MAKVQLDIAHDIELGEFLDMCEEYNLDFKVIEARGPGGGNPLIEFIGDDADVKRFMNDNEYEHDEDY
jgi:hypothetical protein